MPSSSPCIYIGLGSNYPDAGMRLERARNALGGLPRARLEAVSQVYLTEPQNYREQPWFHNQVARLYAAGWRPVELMRRLLEIEKELGRERGGPRFGPRAIDLDVLLFGNISSDNAECVLPHPRLHERAFALVPLVELAPDVLIKGKRAAEWLDGLSWRLDGLSIYQN